jgi:hypothetical protein
MSVRSESYLRFTRRGMFVLFGLVLILGGTGVGLILTPAAASWAGLMTLLPIAIALVAAALTMTLRGDRWDPRSAEARAIMNDEWRATNMNRARHLALGVVLVIHVPLALLLSSLPSAQALSAMATLTMTLGLASLIGAFLYLDREASDRV